MPKFFKQKVTKEKILEVLNHHFWKTGREILRELQVRSSSRIYVFLSELQTEGLVESRVRNIVGFSHRLEYRLTNRGVRRKVEQDAKKETIPFVNPLGEPA